MTNELIVLVTVPDGDRADQLADTLVGERLAACVNIVGPIRSVYRWQGEVCRDDELLLVVKTTRERYAALEALVLELHPYQTPEVIAVPIEAGAAAYRAWIRAETEPKAG
jgi:periplasmic divalent cation tolerance protein